MQGDKKNRNGIFDIKQMTKMRRSLKHGDKFGETLNDREDRAVRIIQKEESDKNKNEAERDE